jgi:membrane-associated phospholipid phosphatase
LAVNGASDGIVKGLRLDLVRALDAGGDCTRYRVDGGAIWLLLWASLAAAAGLALYEIGGYHTGFAVVNDAAASLPARLWEWLTVFGDERTAFALALLFARRSPHVFWSLICAALLAAAYSRGLKPLIDAARPPAVLAADSFHLIGSGHRRESFPSGHSVTAAVFFGVLAYFSRSARLRALLLLFATSVALSRIAVGVHWPVDVAAGLAGGALAALGGIWLARRYAWLAREVSVHLTIVAAAAVMAIGLWMDDGGYAGAASLLKVIAAAAIGKALLVYCVVPVIRLLRQRVS